MADANKTTIFTTEKALARLRESVHAKATNFYAMYSRNRSWGRAFYCVSELPGFQKRRGVAI
jgi:hypothetical protein